MTETTPPAFLLAPLEGCPILPPAPGTGIEHETSNMPKTVNRQTLGRRLDRLGATLHRRTAGCYAQFEDGTVAPWHVQNGTQRIAFSTLANVAAYCDRREENY
ncbi:hypothetical protein [Methylorubrum extorquens]|uniref:hypothetical protein n=1 Tax=Methylorubrum extorquens TaxID=408 RepID=UPI0011BFE276|nr:hypothetical protein [Methylorubrum extorquens]